MNRASRTVLLPMLVAASGTFLGGCLAQPLPADDTYAQRYVGSWRVARAADPQIFSDFVLAADGQLTHLRSVSGGQTVEPGLGAGVVQSAGSTGAAACLFGSAWHSESASRLVVEGACSDGTERDIALSFVDAGELRSGPMAVHTVDELAWMQPTAWSFQKCDARPCQ